MRRMPSWVWAGILILVFSLVAPIIKSYQLDGTKIQCQLEPRSNNDLVAVLSLHRGSHPEETMGEIPLAHNWRRT
jgi:hypothetical protein